MNIFGDEVQCCDDEEGTGGITVFADLAERDASSPITGQQCFVVSNSTQYIWDSDSWEVVNVSANIVTSVNGDVGNVVLTTTDISEGSNQYYTNTRFDNRLATKTTDNLTQGATNKYYNVATVRTDLIDDTATALTKTYSSTKQTATFAPSSHQHPTSAISDFTASATANFNSNLATKTTDNLPQGTTNKYYTSAQFNTDLATKTTDNLPQGATNKYYSSAQFNTDLSTKTTDNLTQGATNKYYSSAQFNADLATKTTTNLPEGSNLYYTQTRADNRARALIDDITPSTTKTYSSNKTDQLYTPISHIHTTSDITNFSTGVNNIITSTKGAVNGIAPLDATGKVPTANLPAGTSLTIDDGTPSTTKVWSSQKTNSEIKVKSVAGKVNDVLLVAGDIGGLNDAIDDRIPAQSVLSVAGKVGAVALVPNDITGLTAEITSKIPIQTVSGRTGNVILTASDIGGLNTAIDDRLTADAVLTVAGRVGNVVIASSDIADLNTTIDGRQKVISVANKTGAVVLNSSDIGGLDTTIDNRVPVKSVGGKTGIITLVSTDITNFDTAVDARLPAIPVQSVAGKTANVVLDSGDITDFSTAVDTRTGSLINDTTPISGKVYSSVKTDATYSKLGHTHNTGDVAETTNLYFTTARNQQLINDTTASATTVYSSTKSNSLYAPTTHNHTTANITNIQDYTDGRITLQKGANNGLATLDAQGHVPTTQIPTDVFGSGDFGTFFETPGNTYGTLTPQGTFFGFTGLQTNTSLTNNITLVENATADRITFANTGIYSINLTLSCQLTQTNSEIQLAIFQNDIQIDRLTVNRFFAAIGSGSMTISGLLPIDAGDYLDVRIAETLQTNREPDVNDVYLSFTVLSNLGPRGHDGDPGVDGKDAVEIVDDLAPAVDTVYSSTKTEATYEKIGHTHVSANITDLSTTTVPEGTNLYFTTARNQQLINDNTNTTTNTYSADKINTLVAGATGVSIDDTTPSGTTTYSSNKINTLNRVNTVATRTGDIVLTSADITNFNTAVDGRIPAQTITSVAGRTGNVLLTSSDIGDIQTYVDGRIPAQTITSVSGRTGAITLLSSDIGDFNTSVDARIPAQAVESVSGRTGAVILTSSDIGDLNTTIDGRIPAQAVASVSGRTGNVILTSSDIGDFNTQTDTRIGLKINDTTPSTSTLYSSTYTDGKYAETAHNHISSEITDLTATVDGQITAKSGTSLCPLTLGKIPTQYLPAGAGVVLDDATASTSTVYSSTKTLQLIGDIGGAEIDDDTATLTTVYSSQFGDSRYLLGTATTDQIDEGKTNLYWTLTRNQSLIDDNSFSLGNTFSSAKITNELLNKANFLHNHDGDYATIGHGHAGTEITYDNSTSGLTATTSQEAIDELKGLVGGGGVAINDITPSLTETYSSQKSVDLLANKADTGHTHTASNITDFNATAITATAGSYSALGHTHTASNITDFNATAITATAGSYSALGHGHAGTEITYDNTTSGLTATTSQEAIDELKGLVSGAGVQINDITPSLTETYSSQKSVDLLANKADTGHTHTASNITDFNATAITATSGSYIAKPVSSVDNTIVRYNGTTGQVQTSIIEITDAGNIDRTGAGTMTIGGVNTTTVVIAKAGTLSFLLGSLRINEDLSLLGNIDKGSASNLSIGAVNALVVNIGKIGRPTTIQGNLQVVGDFDAATSVPLVIGDGNATQIDIGRAGTDIKLYSRLDAGLSGKELRLSTPSTAQIGALTGTINGSIIFDSDTEQLKVKKTSGWTATGDVVGPASSTDNAICRFDATTGKLLQNSILVLDDGGGIDRTNAGDLSIGATTATNVRIGKAGENTIVLGGAIIDGNIQTGGTIDKKNNGTALDIGSVNATAVNIGKAGAMTTISGNLTITGTLSGYVKPWGYISQTTQATVSATTYTKITMSAGTGEVATFTFDNNYLRCDHTINSQYLVTVSYDVSTTVSGNYNLAVYKNATIVSSSIKNVILPDTNKKNVSVSFLLTLTNTNYIEVYASKTGGNSDLLVDSMTMTVSHIADI